MARMHHPRRGAKRGTVIELKSRREIGIMREAGRLVALAHQKVREFLKPGLKTIEIDLMIRDFVLENKGTLLFFNYQGFPAHSCISINEEVVHGIPSEERILNDGDIVSVDIGVGKDGFCGDSAWTYGVGSINQEAQDLLTHCEAALFKGIEQMVVGNRISDISRAIQDYSEDLGYGVVKKFVGHGIGRRMHEAPQVPNYCDKKSFLQEDPVLQEGMVLAVEPMLNVGTEDVETLSDKWTVITKDKKLSAHFEHTIAVTSDGPQVLTVT